MDVLGPLLAVILVAGFGYFIYTRIKKNKNKTRTSGSVGGASPNPPINKKK